MTISRILTVFIVSATLITLTGCQDQQLTQCRQENIDLTAQLQSQQDKYREMQEQSEGVSVVLTELLKEMERLKTENVSLKRSQSNSEPTIDAAKKKVNTQKGLQELFKLRQKSAEQMQKDSQK